MAQELFSFQVTVPAGTLKAAPQVSSLAIPPRRVVRVEWKVPAGPRGVLGFQLGMAGRQLLPYNAGQFIIADDDSDGWDFQGLPTSGAWQCIAYNTGQFAHSIYLRLLTELVGRPLPPAQLTVPPNHVISNPPAPAAVG